MPESVFYMGDPSGDGLEWIGGTTWRLGDPLELLAMI